MYDLSYSESFTIEGTSNEYIVDSAVDAEGNVYLLGNISSGGTVDLDPTAGIDDRVLSHRSVFVTRLNTDGSYGWSQVIELTGTFSPSLSASAITVDDFGNVYVAGQFETSIDVDPGEAVVELISTGTHEDAFVVNLAVANGAYINAWAFESTTSVSITGLGVDQQGNLYIAGDSRGWVDFDPGPAEVLQGGNSVYQGYVTKLLSDGSHGWVQRLTGNNLVQISELAVEASGDFYLVGRFTSNMDFDPSVGVDSKFVSATYSGGDAFISKRFADGSYGWTQTFGSLVNYSITNASKVALDGLGGVYISGLYSHTVDFDGSAVGVAEMVAPITNAPYLVKYSTSGDYQWVRQPYFNASLNAVAADERGNVFIAGDFSGTSVDFDWGTAPGEVDEHTGSVDPFVTRLDVNGNYISTRTSSAYGGGDTVKNMLLDGIGNLYVLGEHTDTMELSFGEANEFHTSQVSVDGFISKWSARDFDMDSIPDAWEKRNGLDPENILDASLDGDSDGLINLDEYRNGTHSALADTDGDSLLDGWEVSYGLDPLSDVDATSDVDLDGLIALDEYLQGTNPIVDDTDGDGILDGADANPLDPNTAPTAYDDNYAVDQSSYNNMFLTVLDNDGDADGDVIYIDSVDLPSDGGEVSINPNGDGLIYTPATNFIGNETFGYTVSDGFATTNALITVTVNEVFEFHVLNPFIPSDNLYVVSLVDNNTIIAGATYLTLNRNEAGVVTSPGITAASSITQGMVLKGTGPFTVGGEVNATDMPVPTQFAGTKFVVPHFRRTHIYDIKALSADANVQIVAGDTYSVLVPAGQVVSVNAGSNNTVSAVITSDQPILVSHRTTDKFDTMPVLPATTDLWGIRSQLAYLGAAEDGTTVSVYASNGATATYNLNAGDLVAIGIGSKATEGRGSGIHIVANKPIGAAQFADSDGGEATSFWSRAYMGDHYALPVDTQYVAVVCPEMDTTVTLTDGVLPPKTKNCSGDTLMPGMVHFGSYVDGVNISAGAVLEGTKPFYMIYEAAATDDEHNLLGTSTAN